MLDDGVMEGERGGGRGEGRREEERSVERDAMRREGTRKTRPLLWVQMFKIYLLPSLSAIFFSLLSPHPLILPLLLFLLHLFALDLLLLLSLPLSIPTLLSLLRMNAQECDSFRCVCGAALINNTRAVITISDTITVKVITLTTVNIITAFCIALINTAVSFAINYWIREVAFLLNVTLQFGFIFLTGATFLIYVVVTCVFGFTVTAADALVCAVKP